MIKKKLLISLLPVLLLYACADIFAWEKINTTDKIISSTFKSLVKAFVATANISKLKKDNIDKLNNMDEEKFQRRYAQVYKVIKDLPYDIKARYGITENMAKEQAIKNIESLDKGKIYKIIDSIPESVIAQQFRQYLSNTKQEIKDNNVIKQIENFWNKTIKKAGRR